MFVYLARPIDQAGHSSWLGTLTLDITSRLALAGVGAFQPSGAYIANTQDPTHTEFIDETNNQAIWRADALVAILPAGIPTLGTPVEISAALMLGKPVLIFTDLRGSVQVAAWRSQGAHVIDLESGEPLPTPDKLRELITPDPEAAKREPDGMVVKYDLGALPLTKAHETDAGFDLATLEDAELHSGQRTLIRTGVHAVPPAGWYGRITGRSSALAKWQIQVHEGIIDAGYTGELMIGVTYQGLGHIDVPAGTRLAQYILAQVWEGELAIVEELPATLRGDRGWGSSGA